MNKPATQPFIQVSDDSKYFAQFCALDAVSLDIELGQKLVICGPSGSGKSTLIRCINRLERHEAGEIRIDGIVVDDSPTGRAVLHNYVGMVFQQFNLFPHLTILENLMLGPVQARKMAAADARDLAMHYLERVRIPEQFSKYPAQLSGGQQQRVAIARALALNPKLIIADEALSALDVSVQAQVLNLMMELQADLGLSFLFISHDMAVVERVSHQVAVMYLGRIVEIGARSAVFENPQHAYTKALMKAVPIADPRRRKKEKDLNFKPIPSPIHDLDYSPAPSQYNQVAPGHYVLTTDSGY